MLLDVDNHSMTRYSRYITDRYQCIKPDVSEDEFLDVLFRLGKKSNRKRMIIPTSDGEALILSRHKTRLEKYYIIPISSFNTVNLFINKRLFYRYLESRNVSFPKTYFPKDITELFTISKYMQYPYLIKPVYSHLFVNKFDSKVFVINCHEQLNEAIEKLYQTDFDIMVQEVIPGNDIYMCCFYFNQKAEPLAICGYDKLRQAPPDFGNGSLCRSSWKSLPIAMATDVLKSVNYHGIAEAEFKRDPVDGQYKLLEINARTTTQSILSAQCKVPVEYVAYNNLIYGNNTKASAPINGILWIDEIIDLYYNILQIKNRKVTFSEVLQSMKGRKVFAVASLDDPAPFIVYLVNFASGIFRQFIKKIRITCWKKNRL